MIVRTVRGDVEPGSLSLVLGHEHIFAAPPPDVLDPDLRLEDAAMAEQELRLFAAAGGGAIVEMTTVDYGRNVRVLDQCSAATGVHVIAATGYNKGKFADRISSQLSTDDIARWMIAEVRDAIEDTPVRPGLIKASSSLNGPGEHERRVFEAAAAAHAQTRAPISTHTEKGTWAIGQVDLLGSRGVRPERILLGHLDLNPDLAYLREVAATGAYMGFDQFSKAKYLSDAVRIELIVKLVAAGHGHQLILSGDMARRSYHQAYGGGPGFAHIPTTIRQALGAAGLNSTQIQDLLAGNAQRFLAFDPVDA